MHSLDAWQQGISSRGERHLTFSELAYGQHAVAGREVPYAQGFVIADGGTEREVGMSRQTPDFSFHMPLQRHTTGQSPILNLP